MATFKKIYFFLSFLSFTNFAANAKDIYASSVNFSDVNAAVLLAEPGDIIYLPSGNADWGANSLTIIGGVKLVGNGSAHTIIRRTQSTRDFLVTFDCANGLPSELHNIRFDGYFNVANVLGANTINTSGVIFTNGCSDFKVSGCHFEGFANAALQIGNSNTQRGVIYNNQFIDNYYPEARPKLGYGVAVYGDKTSWPALELGTENAVYVENNFFKGNRHHIASNNSSKYVFRYNTAEHTETVKNFAMLDAHGYRNAALTGSRSYEIYNNDLVYNPPSGAVARSAVGIRGGDGVIFGNSVSEKIVRTVELWVESSGQCGKSEIPGRINSLYIWDNEDNDDLYGNWAIFRDSITLRQGISVTCPTSIKKDEHYFVNPLPNYQPFTYPHPLRSQGSIGSTNPLKIQAEEYTTQQGVRVVSTNGAGDGDAIGYLQPGDFATYTMYANVAGSYHLNLHFATAIPHGIITFSSNGNYVGEIKAPGTGGWSNYQILSTTVDLPLGTQEIRLDFSNASYIGNIDWLELTPITNKSSVSSSKFPKKDFKVFPNPLRDGVLSIASKESIKSIVVLDNMGKIVLKKSGPIQKINLSNLVPGLYIIQLRTSTQNFTEKVVIRK